MHFLRANSCKKRYLFYKRVCEFREAKFASRNSVNRISTDPLVKRGLQKNPLYRRFFSLPKIAEIASQSAADRGPAFFALDACDDAR